MKSVKLSISNMFIVLLLMTFLAACGGGEKQKTTTQTNRAPSAQFTANPNPAQVGNTVTFNSEGSSDPDSGDTLSYSWQFGDGSSSQAQNPSHTYSSANTFSVSLIVTDDSGASSSPFTVDLSVEGQSSNNAPTASFTANPNPVAQGVAVDFNSSGSSDTDSGDILTYVWLFGDGAASSEQHPSHVYAEAGTYNASLVVTDNHGASSSAAEVSISVLSSNTNNAPTASFTVDKTSVEVSETISFDSSDSSDPDGDMITYNWQFGDGGTSSLANPTYQYSTEGSYTVSLIVTDNSGLASSAAQQVILVETATNSAPVASFTVNKSIVDVGETINFDSSNSSDPDGDTLTFNWQFGDGSSSIVANPTHQYATEGTYTAQLVVTDDSGLASTAAEQVIQVEIAGNSAPSASFTATPNPATVNSAVQFDSGNSSDPEGDSLTYSWDFGDTTSSQSANPSHAYTSIGSYQVELIVTDSNGNASQPFIMSLAVNEAGQFSGVPEPWPETKDLNLIWFGASTTAHGGSGSTPAYDIPRLVKQIYQFSLPAGETSAGVLVTHTGGGRSLASWLSDTDFNDVENGPSNGGNWDYVIATAVKSAEGGPGPSLTEATESVYDALKRVKDSSRANVFVNHPVPRLNGFYQIDTDSEAILTRYECIHTLGRDAASDILNGPTGIAMDTVYSSLPNPELIARLKTYDNFPASFPDNFNEDPNIFIYDVNPGLDPQHYAQPGSYFVANIFATYLYGVNPIGLPLTEFTGFCSNRPSSSLCAISDNMRLFLQAVAYDGVYRYRLGERPKRNGEPVDCDVSDQININGQREDAYLNSLFGG